MALINDYYVFVQDEDVERGISVSEHPVESGLDVTDNVKREAVTIKIAGEIVGDNAASVLSSLNKLHQSGKYVKYVGRNILSNAIIKTFDTSHPNTIYGGCSFSMEIQEIRIAKSPIVSKSNKATTSGTQQVKKNKKEAEKDTYTVKRGDTLWAIAKSYYGNGAQYTKIYNANKDKIKNPNTIYAGQVLTIP